MIRSAARWLRYWPRLVRRQPAGDYGYRYVEQPLGPDAGKVEVKLPAEGPGAIKPEDAAAWCARQTLPALTAIGYDRAGTPMWTVDAEGPAEVSGTPARWFTAPAGPARPSEITAPGAAAAHNAGPPRARSKRSKANDAQRHPSPTAPSSVRSPAGTARPSEILAPGGPASLAAPHLSHLPEVYPAFLESCLLVLAAEQVDAVALLERIPSSPNVSSPADLLTPALRPYCLFDGLAYRYNPATDTVEPKPGDRLVKVVTGGGEPPRDAQTFHHQRRGPYLSSSGLPPLLSVGVRDAISLPRGRAPDANKQRLLVTAPFLARGGAEHTLFETARVLAREFEISIATLAPHRPELGDRRDDFHQITDRIYCLGDLVHPVAMPGILGWLLDQLGIDTLYNANGSTLFYEFFPRLKAERPSLRIVDHLYDHRIGYIDRYTDPSLLNWLDACVAENRKIATALVEESGWPAERVPVIWPCGRAAGAFPEDPVTTRREVRQELGLGESDVAFLTAARMHAQKRPLDFVALAQRVRDLTSIHFLLVGGGDLEGEVDTAIAASKGAPIRRLPFRTDIPRLITAADVGCLLSEHEGLPVFMLECLQAGRPFLGTDAGEMATVLTDTGAGLVTGQPGDLDAIEAAVRRLHDPAIRAELAQKAEGASDRFDVESCAASYAEVLRGDTA